MDIQELWDRGGVTPAEATLCRETERFDEFLRELDPFTRTFYPVRIVDQPEVEFGAGE